MSKATDEQVEQFRSDLRDDINAKIDAGVKIVLSLDQILSADDIQTEWVPIPEWAPKDAENKEAYGLYVRSLNGRERANWQQKSVMGSGKNATVNFQLTTVTLVQYAAVDAAGKPLFTDAQINDLRKKNSAILERISDVAMRLSGIGEEEMDAISGKLDGQRGFAYLLAFFLGWPNVDRMLDQMTSRQLYEWELMFERWHIGNAPHERADISAAIIAQTMAATVMKKVPKIDAFMPTFEKPVELTPEQQASTLRDRMLNAANRGKKKALNGSR